MLSRRALLAIGAALVGLVIVAGGAAVGASLLPHLWASQHLTTGDDLRARPEGHLIYPGAQQLDQLATDETQGGFEPAHDAVLATFFATGDTGDQVAAWYDQQLKALGYVPSKPDQVGLQWSKGAFLFQLRLKVTARPDLNAPPGTLVYETDLFKPAS